MSRTIFLITSNDHHRPPLTGQEVVKSARLYRPGGPHQLPSPAESHMQKFPSLPVGWVTQHQSSKALPEVLSFRVERKRKSRELLEILTPTNSRPVLLGTALATRGSMEVAHHQSPSLPRLLQVGPYHTPSNTILEGQSTASGQQDDRGEDKGLALLRRSPDDRLACFSLPYDYSR